MDPTIILAVAIFEYVFCFVGILANFIVCYTILRYKKTTFSNTFYTLAVALAVPDCVHLFTELTCSLPAVFYGLERTPKWFLHSCGYFADVSFWAIAPLMLVIAVNRFVAVCYFETYKRHFDARRIRILIAFCFIFCFFMPSVMYGCECYYDFKHAWLFSCNEFRGCKNFALNFNATICNSICLAVAIIYVAIYIQHHRVQRRVGQSLQSDDDRKRRAKESKLMFQFGMISTVLIAYQVFFWIFLYVATNDPSEMVLNFLVNLNSCISPFLYLSFGSDIRSRLPWNKQKHESRAGTVLQGTLTQQPSTQVAPNQKMIMTNIDD
jgi:hypothetical protein